MSIRSDVSSSLTAGWLSNYPFLVIPISLIVFAYLMGSIPVGVILGKLKGVDPRKTGSGNIGATNVMRAAGKVFGIITLICDAAKGFIPVVLTIYMGEFEYTVGMVGLAVFLGHLFPVFLRFKGGKGVATALGVYLALSPMSVLGSFVVFAVVLAIWRFVSLASIAGAVAMPLAFLLMKLPYEYVLLATAIAVAVILRHRENIVRLIKGTENKLSL